MTRSQSARAVVMSGLTLEVREYPVKDIALGTISSRQGLCGVCVTDVHNWERRRFFFDVAIDKDRSIRPSSRPFLAAESCQSTSEAVGPKSEGCERPTSIACTASVAAPPDGRRRASTVSRAARPRVPVDRQPSQAGRLKSLMADT